MAKQTKIQEMKNLIAKPELWIGLITVFVVVIVATSILIGRIKSSLAPKSVTNEKQKNVTITPAPIVTETPAAAVTKLANTAGYYEVQEADNFWKISETVCGTGRYFESIQAQNGYESKTLHAGDLLTVECME